MFWKKTWFLKKKRKKNLIFEKKNDKKNQADTELTRELNWLYRAKRDL